MMTPSAAAAPIEQNDNTTNNKNRHNDIDVKEKARQLYRGVALAPMVRASTTPLRALALHYGADFVYTEELVDRSISETIRIFNKELNTIDFLRDISKLSAKHQRKIVKSGPPLVLRIDSSIEKGKLVCQLGTGEVEHAIKAAMHVYKDVDAIDVNMGCPKKFSVSGGMGSALLTDPNRASSIIAALKQALPTTPISAKIRLLQDVNATLGFCTSLVESGGVNAIAIHGRLVGDEATQPSRRKELKETVKLLKAKYTTLPVLVNGDFYTRAEWMQFMEETGADGVLVARPALYNTSIFSKPTDSSLPISTYGYTSPLLRDKTSVIQDYIRYSNHYNTHYKNTKYVVCEMMSNRRTPTNLVPNMPQFYPGNQTIGQVCSCRNRQEICNLWNVSTDDSETIQTAAVVLALPAGEHRYEDSYFTKDTNAGTKTSKNVMSSDDGVTSIGRDAKRARVDDTAAASEKVGA